MNLAAYSPAKSTGHDALILEMAVRRIIERMVSIFSYLVLISFI
jgi:hypothetical protein